MPIECKHVHPGDPKDSEGNCVLCQLIERANAILAHAYEASVEAENTSKQAGDVSEERTH